MSEWFVLWVATGAEEAVAARAKSFEGVKTLVPLARFINRSKGESKEIVKPIFPGYVFINCEMTATKYHELKGLSSVIGWLGVDEMWPTSVPLPEIKRVLKLCELLEASKDSDLKDLLNNAKVDRHKELIHGSVKLVGRECNVTLPMTQKRSEAGVDE